LFIKGKTAAAPGDLSQTPHDTARKVVVKATSARVVLEGQPGNSGVPWTFNVIPEVRGCYSFGETLNKPTFVIPAKAGIQ